MEPRNEAAKRAEEFSPGQAERTEAPPWVSVKKEFEARVSGRQKFLRTNCLPPANAGSGGNP